MAKNKSNEKETAVRDAAAKLQTAIADARAAGYAVTWPGRPDDLTSIEISETGGLRPDADQVDALTPALVEGQRVFGEGEPAKS